MRMPEVRKGRREVTQSLRIGVGKIKRFRRYGEIASRRHATPYVGWVGEGNLGDEAMFLAHRSLLAPLDLTSLPNISALGTQAVARLPWLRCPAICLGGGTLVANGHFRETLEGAMRAWPDAPVFTLGVGVEDPVYETGRRTDVAAELAAWEAPLRRFAQLTVRGPRSQETLRSIGIESTVVGDSALCLPGLVRRQREPGLVAVNVGEGDDQWGSDPAGFRRWAADLTRSLTRRGHRVLFVSTTRQDDEYLRSLAGEVGPGVELALARTPQETASHLSRCDVLIAHKLHAAILAAAVGVPAIALEYRPKCLDFQASVGRETFVMRTDELDAETLLGWVADSCDEPESQSQALDARVEELRIALRHAAETILRQVQAAADLRRATPSR
jgi:hypothetical protein